MVKFQSLSSSSSGNSTFLTDDETKILIDCGATCSYIEKCLFRLGTDGEGIAAIFLTHSHSDHIGAAGVLSRKHGIPIYATRETFLKAAKQLGFICDDNMRILHPGEDVKIGNLTVHAFSIPHDAEGAVSYTVSDHESKFGIATDSGLVTEEILENLTGCETVIVESNHDIEMLKNGPYPYRLKQRILGNTGHLSNEACGALCVTLAKCGTKAFWLGHLSDKNNLPEIAYCCVKQVLTEHGIAVGSDVALNVIPKSWIEVSV